MNATTDLPALREQREALQLQAEIADARRYLAAVRSPILEAHGDWVDPREYLYDTPGFDYRLPFGQRPDSIDDRKGGADYPIFRTEQDLAEIRGQARQITTKYASGVGILEALTNYTIGTGYEYEAQPADGMEPPQGLVEAVQRCVDWFLDDNDWVGDFEREIHKRSRVDGEVFLALKPDGYRVQARVIEPAQVTEPQGPRELERWQGCAESFCSCWKFGVHTRHDDPTAPIGYHVVYDSLGAGWDYYPAGKLEHIKLNTPRNVKRGVSDFDPVSPFLRRADKLLVNVTEGAAIQAAIAFIRKHAAGTTAGQIQTMRTGNAYDTYSQPLPSGGSRTKYVQKFETGTVLDTGQQDYAEGPGAKNSGNFIAVLQADMRYVGLRWSMPEYLVSGDASNANYASTLVAESPFVKAREADQAFYISRFQRVLWKVLRLAYDAGYFSQFGLLWEELERLVDVKIEAPEVASRDALKDAQGNQILKDAGVLSPRTWAAKAGLEYDEEVERGAKAAAAAAPMGGGFGQPQQPTAESLLAIAESLRPPPAPLPTVILPKPEDHSARDVLLASIAEHVLDLSEAVESQERRPTRKIVKRDERGKISEIMEE